MKKILIIFLFPLLAQGQAVTIDSYTKYVTAASVYAGSIYLRGQSFTCGGAYVLDSAKFYISKTGSPTGNAYAYIYAHSGTYGTNSVPTGSPLATSGALDISTLSTSLAWIKFTFSGANQITLSASTYYVVILGSNNGDASNYVSIGGNNSGIHSGNSSYSSNGSSWTSVANDRCFYVYGHAVTGWGKKCNGISAPAKASGVANAGINKINSIVK